jgi:hypothetical protein
MSAGMAADCMVNAVDWTDRSSSNAVANGRGALGMAEADVLDGAGCARWRCSSISGTSAGDSSNTLTARTVESGCRAPLIASVLGFAPPGVLPTPESFLW